MDSEAALVRVPSEVAAHSEVTPPAAWDAARRLAVQTRRRRLSEADAQLQAVAARLEDDLRHGRLELFDRRSRLRQRALAQVLVERIGGKRTISGQELRALIEREDRPATAGAP